MTVTASGATERTRNPLRPERLADVIGQVNAKALVSAALLTTFDRFDTFPHTLFIGPSGTGKTTFSHAIANELGVDVYAIEAPVSFDTLMELRTTMRDKDILQIEEIHQQAIMERRGRSAATRPEVLYAVMEDRTIPTQEGVQAFPEITVIGTTTDEGMLPDAFINRFPLRPHLDPYSRSELRTLAEFFAGRLRLPLTASAADVFCRACRGVPRELGNMLINAQLTHGRAPTIGEAEARATLRALRVSDDGLNADMQAMLTQLYTKCARQTPEGTRYQASVNTIASLIGKSRDTKAVALRVEPFLIENGYVQVGHSGRFLTDAGARRARELVA